MDENTVQQIENIISKLQSDLNALSNEYYKNNFSSSQDFQKYSRFNTRIKIPHYDSLPATCEVGEICESAGKARICSAANTWSIIGAQS